MLKGEKRVRLECKGVAGLEKILMDLSYEEVADLVTLMLIGREDDADMTLEKDERFLDYWRYLSEEGVFNSKEWLVEYMIEKAPLSEYLKRGLEILGKPVCSKEAGLEEFDVW